MCHFLSNLIQFEPQCVWGSNVSKIILTTKINEVVVRFLNNCETCLGGYTQTQPRAAKSGFKSHQPNSSTTDLCWVTSHTSAEGGLLLQGLSLIPSRPIVEHAMKMNVATSTSDQGRDNGMAAVCSAWQQCLAGAQARLGAFVSCPHTVKAPFTTPTRPQVYQSMRFWWAG